MDYKTDKLASRFIFNNPNEKGTCGCGVIFYYIVFNIGGVAQLVERTAHIRDVGIQIPPPLPIVCKCLKNSLIIIITFFQ